MSPTQPDGVGSATVDITDDKGVDSIEDSEIGQTQGEPSMPSSATDAIMKKIQELREMLMQVPASNAHVFRELTEALDKITSKI